MSPIHIALGKAGISVAVTKGSATVHITRIYMVSWEYVLGTVIVAGFLIWFLRRSGERAK